MGRDITDPPASSPPSAAAVISVSSSEPRLRLQVYLPLRLLQSQATAPPSNT
jgi:hypothetical protein